MLARCREIGLPETTSVGLDATLSARGTRASARELPRISVDLRSLGSRATEPGRTEATVGNRDLEVLSTLGEGGMGRVLLARQHSLDREVALKTLRGDASDRERAALISEGAITGHLEHPTIIPVHALGLDADANPVLVMKRVEGVEWSELLDHPQHEAWGERPRDRLVAHLEILMQVANAVHFAHSRKIIHRDIKPQNVLIGRYGDVYLGDWGLAMRIDRPFQPQPLCGTPAYMAPEMVIGAEVDERTDVYLLGATLHHILTGEPRNRGENARDVLLGAVDAGEVRYPPSVPEPLARLANRATARDPAARHQSALAFRQALGDYLDHRSSIALAESAAARIVELKRLGQPGELGSEETQLAFDRGAVEARFALEQALQQWSENEAARTELRELDELLAARRARAAELERLARELDPTVAGIPRALLFAAVAVAGVALSAVAILTRAHPPSPRSLFLQSLGPLGVLCALTVLLRRHAFATAFNRRMLVAGLAIVGGITLSRGLGLLAGATTPEMLLHDACLGTVLSAVCATFLFRWIAWFALVMLAVAVISALDPAQAMFAFSVGTGFSLVLSAYLAWRVGTRR